MSDGFLSRWSRRKRGLEQEPPAPAPEEPAQAPAPEAEAEFDPASLPPLESLDTGGDLTAFLHPRVPALLRQAALRRAWAADPGIRDFMGPADYAWDYNAPDGVPGFSPDLGNVDLKKLLAQMIGEPPEPEPAGEAGEDVPAEAPPGETPADPAPQPLLAEAPPLPPSPLRLSPLRPEPEAPGPLPLAEDAPAVIEAGDASAPEAAAPARRRHGGALPRLG